MKLSSWFRRIVRGPEDPDNFGNVAVDLGYVTNEDVKKAVEHQKQRLPIGEILVLLGYMSEWERDQVLLEQDMRRAANNAERASVELRRQGLIITQLKRSLKDMTDATTTFVTATDCTGRSIQEMNLSDESNVLPMVASVKK